MRPISNVILWLPAVTVALFLGAPVLPGQGWQDLPNTQLQTVCPPNNFQPAGGGMPPYNFSDNCHYVYDAWNSAAADTKRNRLIVWGGGHAAYPGNEVYSLDMTAITPNAKAQSNAGLPAIRRLNDPSVFWTDCPTNPPHITNPDGTPIQRHTYGSPVYLPRADKMFAWEGPDMCGFSQYKTTWLLDLSTLTWNNMQPGGFNVAGSTAGQFGAFCALDTTTTNESVICIWSNNILLRYDAVANTWTQLTKYAQWQTQNGGTVVVDPTRKILFEVGPDYTGTPGTGRFYAIDLTSPTFALSDWTSQVTGCDPLINIVYPGLVYDPTLNRIVGYPTTGGNSVYIFDPATKSCTTQTYAGAPTGSASQNLHGIFGRFNYFPALGKYVVANNSAGDAYTLTLGAAAPPDTTPPLISMTAPISGSTVSGSVTVSATASDNVGVASVQFTLDGANLGTLLTTSPYSISWNTTASTTGSHTLSAVARDAAGNSATASTVSVTVNNSPPPPPTTTGVQGLGQSTITCLDKDGDHYGVGPGCSGPDADDNDPTIHTGAEAIAKYGTLNAFLAHLGYNPVRIWYIAPATATPPGSNTSGAVNDAAHPFLDWSGIVTKLAPGDMVILRGGTYSFWAINAQKVGTAASPLVIMSYPGELASFTTYPSGFDMLGAANIVLDGMLFHSNGSNAGIGAGNNTNATFRHIDSSGNEWGLVASDIANMTIEDSVFHDNAGPGGTGGQHGIYLANHSATPSNNVTVRRNLLYNNDYTGFQFNGKVTNLVVEQNVAYNNSLSGFSWLTGVNHSIFRDNVAFNNGQAGLTINNYSDFCSAYDPGAVGTTCPYDQNYNLIENFTVYNSGKDRDGGGSISAQAAIKVGNTALGKPGDLGHNTFRNIAASVPAMGNQYQPIVFLDTDKDYLATSVFDHILFNQLDTGSGAGSAVVGFGYSTNFGYNPYSCTQAPTVTTMTNCINADPKFVSASIGYWNAPASFDLRLQSSSPAIHAGTSVGALTYDVLGNLFANPPSIGAYEFTASSPAPTSPCDINHDGVVDIVDMQAAVNQALGVSACGSADLQQNGQCNVVDVQRVIVAILGGACVVGK